MASKTEYVIHVPADIEVVIPNPRAGVGAVDKKVYTFSEFIMTTVLFDQKWGASTQMMYAAMDLRGLFDDVKAGAEVHVLSSIFQKMLDVLRSPASPYFVPVVSQLRPFFMALEDAKTEDTEEKKSE